MKAPSKDLYQMMTAKQAALYVFNLDADLVNPFDKTDNRYHEFNNELFNLECDQ